MKRLVFLLFFVALLIVFSTKSQAFEGIIVNKTTQIESGVNPEKAFMKLDGYPILTVTKNKYGTNRTEVIKIQKKRLAGDLFDIPDGYEKRSFKGMMKQ